MVIGKASKLRVSPPTPVASVSPVTLTVPGRVVDLELRVSAPVTGSDLPILLLSHVGGLTNYLSSFRGFSPLVDFWAAHGFVVIQPTHLSSRSLGLDPKTLGAPLFWRSRIEDIHQILDQMDAIEAAVPEILGQLSMDVVKYPLKDIEKVWDMQEHGKRIVIVP